MIKRRFYKHEHGGDHKDEPSGSSSSSSDSEAYGEDFESVGDGVPSAAELEEPGEGCSTSSGSGYQSEDSSANEVDIDSSGLPINDDEDNDETKVELQIHGGDNQLSVKHEQSKQIDEVEELLADLPACVLKCKSVFKCRLCPRIVCLNEESLRAHLKSKRHSRSEKLLNEGRLKATLNSDGEIDNGDMSAKEEAEVVPVSQNKRKRERGSRRHHGRRQKNNKLKKKKAGQDSDVVKARSTKDIPANKRRKQEK